MTQRRIERGEHDLPGTDSMRVSRTRVIRPVARPRRNRAPSHDGGGAPIPANPAPTDDAFAALGLTSDNIGEALDQGTLTKVLLYHVAPGRRYAEDVVSADRMRTLLKGKRGFFRVDATVLTDNLGRTSTIVATDVEADNGVIHAIDNVLLPVAPSSNDVQS